MTRRGGGGQKWFNNGDILYRCPPLYGLCDAQVDLMTPLLFRDLHSQPLVPGETDDVTERSPSFADDEEGHLVYKEADVIFNRCKLSSRMLRAF